MRELDLVVYGATGVTGRQAARYLDQHAGALRWGIAGRSQDKLEALKRGLRDPRVAVIVADASAPESLAAMARRTHVVASTVGPFRRYGTPLVEACVAERSHYCDITGETAWVRSLLDGAHERAKAALVKLVPFSGYDSVPSDLGTFLLVEHAREAWGVGLERVEAFHSARGGYNGGTLATLLDMASGGGRGMGDPWLLSPGFEPTAGARALDRELSSVERRPEGWIAPFVMARINTRVVRRSVALFAAEGRPYGRDFAYQEYWRSSSLAGALEMAAVAGGLAALTSSAAGRALVARFGKKPGEGPSEASMERGAFTARYRARTEDGRELTAIMRGEGDPGNKSTVRFLMETAMALAEDTLPPRFGVLTPATAIGARLLERCRPRGLSFEIT